jgi:hypothetical protein
MTCYAPGEGVFIVNSTQVYYFIVLCVFSDTLSRCHCTFLMFKSES